MANADAMEQNSGGACYGNDGSGTIAFDGCEFVGNRAELDAGGAILTQTPLTVTNSTFERNFAQRGGGAIHNSASLSIVDDAEFSENVAVSPPDVALECSLRVDDDNAPTIILALSYLGVDKTRNCFGLQGVSGGAMHNYGVMSVSGSVFKRNRAKVVVMTMMTPSTPNQTE
eukprot:jgi/Chlat1/5272/Chrsp336S04996